MWIASKFGFFSIVQKDGGWHVRARDKNDLASLQRAVGGQFARLKIHVTPDADYIARVFVPENAKAESDKGGSKVVGEIMQALGESVDYGNFKGMIGDAPNQRGKLPYYHRIWHVMAELQADALVIADRAKKKKRKTNDRF